MCSLCVFLLSPVAPDGEMAYIEESLEEVEECAEYGNHDQEEVYATFVVKEESDFFYDACDLITIDLTNVDENMMLKWFI
jgi:hypothetical protein